MNLKNLVRGGFSTRQAKTLVSEAGGGAPGVPVLRAFPFDHTTPGLATGHNTGYTPTEGDLLLNAWIDVVTAFNGTTPRADFGFFGEGLTQGVFGFWDSNHGPIDLTQEALEYNSLPDYWAVSYNTHSLDLISQGGAATSGIAVPARVGGGGGHPIKIVASQNGEVGGTALDSTNGSAVLYLLTVTPVA